MPDLTAKIVTASEVAGFYKQYPGFWFLLEVLRTSENGKAELMKLLKYDKQKEVLRDYLLEVETDMSRKFIFVYASPDGKCEI